MDRTAASVYLDSSLMLTASEMGVSRARLASVFALATDDALLSLSVTYANLMTGSVPDTAVIGFRVLLTYFGLVRLHESVLASVDISLDGPTISKRLSQYVAALERRIAGIASSAALFATAGPLVTSSGYDSFGSFNTGYMTLSGSEF